MSKIHEDVIKQAIKEVLEEIGNNKKNRDKLLQKLESLAIMQNCKHKWIENTCKLCKMVKK